jgi:hypothetical protein
MSFIVHAATTAATGLRSLFEDMALGFTTGGIAGVIVRVVRGSRWSEGHSTLVVGRWGLVGVVCALGWRLFNEIR